MKDRSLARIIRAFLVAILFLAAAVAAPSACFAEEAGEGAVRIVILHTNDMHGQVRSLVSGGTPTGGFARLRTAVETARKQASSAGNHVFLLDAGDIYQGTPEGNLSKGRLVVGLMSRLGYHACTLGNHEFDDGAENIKALATLASFPFLTANVVLKSTGLPPAWVKPWIVLKAGAVKVGVFGITTPDVALFTFPEHTKGLAFLTAAVAAKKAVKALRSLGATVVVALTHLGTSEDVRLARAVGGIDLIVGGHSHTVLKSPVILGKGAPPIVQAGSKAYFLGRVEITVDPKAGKIIAVKAGLLPINARTVPEDPDFAAHLKKICAHIDVEMGREIGSADEAISRGGRRHSGVSSPLGNLLTDVMREATRTDLAFHNRTGMRDKIRKGPITLRDVYRVSPFGNTVVVMKLTGAQLAILLEKGLRYGSRFMLEISGGTFAYSRTGEDVKLLEMTVGGKPLEPERLYAVATNNFLASGGDGHEIFAKAREIKDTGLLLRDLLAAYLKRNTPIKPSTQRRITRRK
jgi:2',3'-cyclic-nucleotide 2'-phosphodiesterase (5'-nucleotidase family)